MTATQELTRALKMIVDAFTDLGYEDTHILGLVNLIINHHIQEDGDFTDEYRQIARRAANLRDDEPVSIITIAQG